jgi:hypothetical protein
LLEQQVTGCGWPIDSSGSAVKVVTSNNELNSSSHTNVGKFSILPVIFSTEYFSAWISSQTDFLSVHWCTTRMDKKILMWHVIDSFQIWSLGTKVVLIYLQRGQDCRV